MSDDDPQDQQGSVGDIHRGSDTPLIIYPLSTSEDAT